MKNTKFMIVCILLLLTASGLLYADTMIEIPGLGEVGYEKKDDSTYTFGIPKIGTFDFKGVFNNKNDFDLKAKIPISAVTDYIPVVGQVLGILGLDSVTYRITPSGLGLNIHLEKGGTGMFREYLIKELHVFEWQRVGTEAILSSLEVVNFDMSTLFNGGSLTGSISGKISLVGIDISFATQGTISFKSIINSVIASVKNKSEDIIAKYGRLALEKSKRVVTNISGWSRNTANRLIQKVGVIAHDVKASVSHGGHSFDKCYNECTIDYANSQRQYFLKECKNAFFEFYNKVYHDLYTVIGESPQATSELRASIINEEWLALATAFDKKWYAIMEDDEVENYFFRNSSERKARDRYRQLIQESFDEYTNYRNMMHWWLMSRTFADFNNDAPSSIPANSEFVMNGYNQVILQSKSDRFSLVLQYDGNLVLYKDRNTAIWSSNTYNKPVYAFIFQADGNPSVYRPGEEFWSPYVGHQGGANMVLQDDGNLVVYTNEGKAIWASNSSGPINSVGKGVRWVRTDYNHTILLSDNGKYSLVFQADGNLVLYRNGTEAIWASDTYGKPVEAFVFQEDGNPSVYRPGEEFWSPYVGHRGGEKLILQNDGNLVIYTVSYEPIWSTDTWER